MRMDDSDANTPENDTHPSWQPIRLRDVEQGEAGIPVVDDLIYKGGVTLLSAREKAGKTTAINLLAQKLYADRPSTFLGLAVHRSKVLFVSEETALTWIPRREDSEAPPDMLTILRPQGTSDSYREWERFCQSVGKHASREKVDVVILDTWHFLNPADSENNNTEVARALRPVQTLADDGFAVLLIHHQAKGGGIRGGTGLPAGVDMVIEMTRRSDPRFPGDQRQADSGDDSVRRFEMKGRYPSPSTIVARWTGSDYEVIQGETIQHAKTTVRRETLHQVLVKHGPLALAGIRKHWPPDKLRIGASSTLKRDIKTLQEAGRITIDSTSAGGGSDPHLYRATGGPLHGYT